MSRMVCWGRIAPEANALGKAEGYADRGTVNWLIEVQVGANHEHVETGGV